MRYFRFQLHQLLTNRKNLAVIGIALVALLCQFVFFPPNNVPAELPTRNALTRDRDKNVAFVNEPHGPLTAKWVPATREFANIETRMLNAQKQQHTQAYVKATLHYLAFLAQNAANPDAQTSPFHYPLSYYFENRQYPDADAAFANATMYRSLEPLAKQAHPDTAMVKQQTFWQTLFRGAAGGWLTALLIVTILFANDLLTREQRHRSIARLLPISPWHAVNAKTFTVFTALSGFLVAAVAIIAAFVIPQHGLGSLSAAIAYYAKDGMSIKLDPLALGIALPTILGLTLLLMWLFIRLNLLCQLLFHNELVGLVVSALLLFGEPLYFMHGIAFSVPQTAYYLPGYMNPAAIVSGLQNFRYDTSRMSPLAAVVVIGSMILILELVLFIVTHRRCAAIIK
ncbi:ABC transporter permease [Lacticaseibacillus parahuelsenbergensis]|uniref:ABC transporter permease n=1 Tax=Lacticaseibacillus parahuelsenbergensis TaxID=3068305 RepID=A0ABY9L1P3_9LACO|nr:ABC transporter permease [Lacticaseibacillus sp. NCIMB 15471]WLV77433.1 ABC transporter permease [Lacticaseibacillus sp. NCIMB 15471]